MTNAFAFLQNKVKYNVTENKTDFLEPRYDCGVKMKIDLSRAGTWKFVQMVEGDKIYCGEFKITVLKYDNQVQVKSFNRELFYTFMIEMTNEKKMQM